MGSRRTDQLRELGLSHLHRPGRLRENNRVENSHLPIRRRERQQQGFKSQASAQKILTNHAANYNTFNVQRQRISRPTFRRFRAGADAAWAAATALDFVGSGKLRPAALNLTAPSADRALENEPGHTVRENE